MMEAFHNSSKEKSQVSTPQVAPETELIKKVGKVVNALRCAKAPRSKPTERKKAEEICKCVIQPYLPECEENDVSIVKKLFNIIKKDRGNETDQKNTEGDTGDGQGIAKESLLYSILSQQMFLPREQKSLPKNGDIPKSEEKLKKFLEEIDVPSEILADILPTYVMWNGTRGLHFTVSALEGLQNLKGVKKTLGKVGETLGYLNWFMNQMNTKLDIITHDVDSTMGRMGRGPWGRMPWW